MWVESTAIKNAIAYLFLLLYFLKNDIIQTVQVLVQILFL